MNVSIIDKEIYFLFYNNIFELCVICKLVKNEKIIVKVNNDFQGMKIWMSSIIESVKVDLEGFKVKDSNDFYKQIFATKTQGDLNKSINDLTNREKDKERIKQISLHFMDDFYKVFVHGFNYVH